MYTFKINAVDNNGEKSEPIETLVDQKNKNNNM